MSTTQITAVTARSWNVLSTLPWYTQVGAQVPGSGSPVDLHTDTVAYTFLPAGTAPTTPPDGSGWNAGAWTTVTVGSNTVYLASIEVGPSGTVTLPAGEYVVWIYVADTLGKPAAQVGTLTITTL